MIVILFIIPSRNGEGEGRARTCRTIGRYTKGPLYKGYTLTNKLQGLKTSVTGKY